MKLNKYLFYVLSLLWGLPLSLIGVIVLLVLLILKYRPKKYGHCYYIAIGEHWGGLEFGWFFLTDKDEDVYILNHELGHAYQNLILGPFTFVLWIIAACRYWLKRLGIHIDYYSWWYESQANSIGSKIMKND